MGVLEEATRVNRFDVMTDAIEEGENWAATCESESPVNLMENAMTAGNFGLLDWIWVCRN